MADSTKYVLDGRVDNYGWPSLAQAPDTVPSAAVSAPDIGEGRFEGAPILSVPVARTPPHVLNRVNAWLHAYAFDERCPAYSLEVRGVHDRRAILVVHVDGSGDPNAGDALGQIVQGLSDENPRTRDLLGTFLGVSDRRGHEASPTEVLDSVKSSFGTRDLFSVKSSFSTTSRSVVRVLAPPEIPPASGSTAAGVVVAVPDTGIGAHPWLDGSWDDAEALYGWQPSGADRFPDADPADDAAIFAGHGTFVAGLVRQNAPAARILSLRSMSGDGTQPGERLLHGLQWLRERVAQGGADAFVDVVCLACGYYEPSPAEHDHTTALREVLWDLGDLGAQVVVAAGNDTTDSPTFPAAFSHFAADGTRPGTPLVAVGALNPDGSRTRFSNHGEWVTEWQPGVALLSSVPTSGDRAPSTDTARFEPARLVGGFAQWSGTSFAAGVLAGKLAAELARTKGSTDGIHARTRAARAAVGFAT